MKLIISGLGLIICTVALIYMIVKKPNSKQRNAEISKNTLQLIPERDYDDELEAFIVDKDMTGYQYMDLIEIKSQDLQNLSDDEVYFNMAKFATVYKGNIIKNLIMDCQSYTKYRPNETTGGIFVSWRRKEELSTGA